jgi:hypothetical protein
MGIASRRTAVTTLILAFAVLPTASHAAVTLVTTRAALGSDLIDWGKTTGGSTPVGFASADGIVGTTTSAGGDL